MLCNLLGRSRFSIPHSTPATVLSKILGLHAMNSKLFNFCMTLSRSIWKPSCGAAVYIRQVGRTNTMKRPGSGFDGTRYHHVEGMITDVSGMNQTADCGHYEFWKIRGLLYNWTQPPRYYLAMHTSKGGSGSSFATWVNDLQTFQCCTPTLHSLSNFLCRIYGWKFVLLVYARSRSHPLLSSPLFLRNQSYECALLSMETIPQQA